MKNDTECTLSKEDILKAGGAALYNDCDLYVEMPGEYPYYRISKGHMKWERSEKLDEYWDSSLMMSYLKSLSGEEAIKLLEQWKRTST